MFELDISRWNLEFSMINQDVQKIVNDVRGNSSRSDMAFWREKLNTINDTIQTIQNLKQDYPIGTSIGIEHTYNDLHDLEDELKNIGKLVQDRLNNSSTGGIKRKRTKRRKNTKRQTKRRRNRTNKRKH